MTIQEYNLPDLSIMTGSQNDLIVFVPPGLMVIMGNGSNAQKELDWNTIAADNVPVYKRKTGGCSVVLSEKMVVAAFSLLHTKKEPPMHYFNLFNSILLYAFGQQNITGIEIKGISDLTINNLKISGSSMYQNKEKVFFHIVINVSEDIDVIHKYLKHPPREPEYRKGRKHNEFVTSLKSLGKFLDTDRFYQDLKTYWEQAVRDRNSKEHPVKDEE